MKKILISLLLISILFTASCGKSEVPKGFKAAHISGEPFKLYVPESWLLNTAGGVSGAYISSSKKISVSARHYAASDPEMTLDAYIDDCARSYADTLEKFDILKREEALLGGFNALMFVYTNERDGEKFTVMQITTKHSGLMISFNYTAPGEYYEIYLPEAESMLEVFVVTGTLDFPDEEVVDKKTPEGMKIASASHLSFRMYVPKNWLCTPSDGGSTAIYNAGGVRANVTATSFSPSEILTVDEYAELCETEYKKNIAGFSLLEKSGAEMAGKKAVRLVFGAEYDGIAYKILQVSVVYDEIAYSVTYTALAEQFDTALADAEKIIENFEFR